MYCWLRLTFFLFQYNIEKKEDSDADEEDEDDDDFGGPRPSKADFADDPAGQAKALAEAQMEAAKKMAGDKCSIQ